MPTPSDPEPPPSRPALEPTHVLRRHRPGALSELVRQVREREREYAHACDDDSDDGYEIVPAPSPAPAALPPVAEATEDDTQEMPPVTVRDDERGDRERGPEREHGGHPTARRRRPAPGRWPWQRFRRTAFSVAAVAAALAGFAAAFALTWDNDAPGRSARTPTPPAASSDPVGRNDPDGPGTLREGDRGPAVSELQERLLRIPNVYSGGPPSGVYDATLAAAVARFQLWYGIRGDETGVYGNDTRTDLESRTTS